MPTPGLLGKDVYQTEGCRPSPGSRLAAAGGWDSAQERAFPWLTAMRRRMLGAQTRHMGPKSLISLIELSFLLNERRLLKAGCRDGSYVGLCGSWGAGHPGPFSGLFLRGASARGLPVRGVRATPSTPRRGQPRGAGASAPHSPPRALCTCPLLAVEVLALHLQSAKAPRSHDHWQDVGPCHLLSPELGLEGGSVELAAEAGAAVLSHAGEMRESDTDSGGPPGLLLASWWHSNVTCFCIPVAA